MPVGFSGANFLVADTGSVCVVESEGNARMCLTLPRVLITLAGIEKVVPAFADLEVFLQLLPRSATGERMNPYNTIWTGVTAGDGPAEFHVILLDNGRTKVLADRGVAGNAALHPLRGLPERLPGLPADRRPRLRIDLQRPDRRHPHAAAPGDGALARRCRMPRRCAARATRSVRSRSTFPEILIHLRRRIVEAGAPCRERAGMKAAALAFSNPAWLQARADDRPVPAAALHPRRPDVTSLPGPFGGWTKTRDLPAMPPQSFREWWSSRRRRVMTGTPAAGARGVILGRIRDILGERPRSAAEEYAGYRTGVSRRPDARRRTQRVELFVDRLQHYQVGVYRCEPATLRRTIARDARQPRRRRRPWCPSICRATGCRRR